MSANNSRLNVSAEKISAYREIDLADVMTAAYGGDARPAAEELRLDADFLRDQLDSIPADEPGVFGPFAFSKSLNQILPVPVMPSKQ